MVQVVSNIMLIIIIVFLVGKIYRNKENYQEKVESIRSERFFAVYERGVEDGISEAPDFFNIKEGSSIVYKTFKFGKNINIKGVVTKANPYSLEIKTKHGTLDITIGDFIESGDIIKEDESDVCSFGWARRSR